MKFVCSNCKAKYEIPAERIKGRILKIRCRECGNVIEIRGDAIAAAKAGGGAAVKPVTNMPVKSPSTTVLKDKFKASFTARKPLTLPSTSRKGAAIPQPPTKADKLLKLAHKAEARALEMKETDNWYVAIKSSPVGPVNKAKIRSYIRRGDLGLSSLVWREGFNDWKPLRTVTEIAKLYDELKDEIHAPKKIDVAARLRRAAASEVPVSSVSFDPGSNMEKPIVVGGRDEVVSVRPVDVSQPPAAPAATASEAGQPAPAADDALRGFYVGRIDAQGTLPEAEAVRPSYAAEFMPMGFPAAEAEQPLIKRLMQSRLFLLLGGATALMAGFVIMIVVMTAVESEEEKEGVEGAVQEGKEKQQPLVQEDEAEQGDILAGLIITVEEVLEAEEKEEVVEKAVPGKQSSYKKKDNNQDKVFKTTVSEMPDIEETSIASSALKKKVEKKSTSSGLKGKNGLSDDEIKTVVKKNSKTIKRCYEKVLGKGMGIDEKIKVKVQVKVGTSGKVTKVKVIDVSKYGNFLTPCIENGIKTWVFPRSDAPSEFIFPVLLTPKS